MLTNLEVLNSFDVVITTNKYNAETVRGRDTAREAPPLPALFKDHCHQSHHTCFAERLLSITVKLGEVANVCILCGLRLVPYTALGIEHP